MGVSDASWHERAEQAEAAAFRLQCKIRFLVDDVRAYIARERRSAGRSERLAALAQSAGIAEAVLREDEPWRAVAMRIALLEERAGHDDTVTPVLQ
jgi:hypothetical protein